MPARPPARTSREGKARPIKGHVLLDEKTARRLRRLRWRRLLIAVSVIGALAAAAALFFSPLLRVQRLDVAGTTTVSSDEVQELAGLKGQSMLLVDLAAARERIAALPALAAVQVERHWPQAVRITVTERQPWGHWQSGEHTYVIDAEGVVLSAQAPEGAPAVRDLGEPAELSPGDRVDSGAVQLTRFLLERVPAQLALNVAALDYSPASGLTVTTDAGYRVVIGDSRDMEYKLAVWREIEARLGREAMAGHVLDLRFGDRPSFQ